MTNTSLREEANKGKQLCKVIANNGRRAKRNIFFMSTLQVVLRGIIVGW